MIPPACWFIPNHPGFFRMLVHSQVPLDRLESCLIHHGRWKRHGVELAATRVFRHTTSRRSRVSSFVRYDALS